MLFSNITYIDEHYQSVAHAYIGTCGRKITYISTEPPQDKSAFGREYDGKGKLLISAFFNAHTHLAMGLLRGYGESMTLSDWLNKRIFPFEAKLTDEDVYWGTMLCAAEMLSFGTVAATDMYMHPKGLGQAVVDSGIKGNLSLAATDFAGRTYQELHDYSGTMAWIEQLHGHDAGRIKIDFSLHAEYTSHPTLVRSLAEVAQQYQHRMHVHVSETAAEVAACKERHNGLSPVAYLAECGLFDVPTTAAHCVHISAADMDIFAEKKISVASCPKSNLKLASGIAPIPELLRRGINVALGTDSVASNNNLNMPEEMRFFSLLHKGISGDPTVITPAETLHAATRAGALSQGREDCGAIAVGNCADLVLIDAEKIHMQPVHDLLNNLIYSASGSDVELTMVDGEVRYERGDWPHLDIERIRFECEKTRQRILSQLA